MLPVLARSSTGTGTRTVWQYRTSIATLVLVQLYSIGKVQLCWYRYGTILARSTGKSYTVVLTVLATSS